MAAPIIRSLVSSKSEVAPGESFTITVDAFDPDNQSLSFLLTGTDAGGSSATATLSVQVGDPLTFTLEETSEAGAVIRQDSADPHVFHVTAPGA